MLHFFPILYYTLLILKSFMLDYFQVALFTGNHITNFIPQKHKKPYCVDQVKNSTNAWKLLS